MNKKNMVLLVLVPFVLLFMMGCDAGVATGKIAANDKLSDVQKVADNEEYVRIPLSDLSSNVKFYDYNDEGVMISYFAVLGSDGEPRTAFDACDVCGGKKGYRQEGNDIVCNNCGRVFDIDGLGTENKGYGCWPSYLPHELQGDQILIKINDIKNGMHRFA